jgi:quercetin dioxygenase-like cupin family protein
VPLAGPVAGGAAGSGVHRSLTDGEDLHANLVHLDPDGSMPAHVNDELDVLVVVLAGTGTLVLEGAVHDLDPPCAVLVPRGSERAVRAGADGLDYLTVHRRRGPLGIRARPPRR